MTACASSRCGAVALRTPWTLCRGAVNVLDRLVGMPLSADPQAVYRHADGRAQCTHLFDLAGLAISHAARGIAERQYDVEVPCLDPRAPREALLSVDGQRAARVDRAAHDDRRAAALRRPGRAR